MMRGYSLEQDLKLLMNDPKYSDIELFCEDEMKLYGCRAILAARSEVFNKLLYNGMKESHEKQIFFPKIHSSGMKIILEYTYTGSVKEESLTKDNIVEAFNAADYFQLPNLQGIIVKNVKKNDKENYSPELLSKVLDTMPLLDDSTLLNSLAQAVATTPLNTIKFGRLSIAAFQYLLSYTYEEEIPFATQEYEVFRYGAILAAKHVSNDAYEILMKQLPTLEKIENSVQVENKFITHQQKVAKKLEPLVRFFEFGRIKGQILTDIIEPLKIVPSEIIISVYRQKVRSNYTDLNEIRGAPYALYVWDESTCGTKLIVEDNGKVVRTSNKCGSRQSAKAKIIPLDNKGILKWDVIIEKNCELVLVGVCASENFNYEASAGLQSTGWTLGSSGHCYNSGYGPRYCPSFKDGTKITVHLDMNKRTCAFAVNNKMYPEVSEWRNLPSKLYPVVSLSYPGRLRIQPYQNV